MRGALFTIAYALLVAFLDAAYRTPYDSRWGASPVPGYHLWLVATSFLPFLVVGLWSLASPKKRGQLHQDEGQKWGILLDAAMRGFFVTLVDDTTYGLFKYALGLWGLIDLIEWYRVQFCLTCDWFWWWADFYFFRVPVTPQLMALTIVLRAQVVSTYLVARLVDRLVNRLAGNRKIY
jgi:hypothetical protein